jgi:hypothetical protein
LLCCIPRFHSSLGGPISPGLDDQIDGFILGHLLEPDKHERFGAFAILPLSDVAASLVELDRALDELELDGVALPTHAAGRYLGDQQLAPVM